MLIFILQDDYFIRIRNFHTLLKYRGTHASHDEAEATPLIAPTQTQKILPKQSIYFSFIVF
jgi:hypothetical protein